MKKLLLIFLFISAVLTAQTKQIAITFDDLPTLSHGVISEEDQIAYFGRILKTLDKYNIEAMGFVAGQNVKEFNDTLLSDFVNAGHKLGNHSFSHYDLNKVNVEEYSVDIMLCEILLEKL